MIIRKNEGKYYQCECFITKNIPKCMRARYDYLDQKTKYCQQRKTFINFVKVSVWKISFIFK